MIHVWTKPPFGKLPIRGRTVRMAVGTPTGKSSNSWSVKTNRKGDVYVYCRDNFKEVKASLHQSGKWRFGHTKEATPLDLVEFGSDRVWTKWQRPSTYGENPIVAFRVHIPEEGLYLSPQQRIGWKPTIFVEPPMQKGLMSVISICAIPRGTDFNFEGTTGGRIAVLTLDERLDIHVLVSNHQDTSKNGLHRIREKVEQDPLFAEAARKYLNGVILAHGSSDDGVRFVMPYPLQSLIEIT